MFLGHHTTNNYMICINYPGFPFPPTVLSLTPNPLTPSPWGPFWVAVSPELADSSEECCPFPSEVVTSFVPVPSCCGHDFLLPDVSPRSHPEVCFSESFPASFFDLLWQKTHFERRLLLHMKCWYREFFQNYNFSVYSNTKFPTRLVYN